MRLAAGDRNRAIWICGIILMIAVLAVGAMHRNLACHIAMKMQVGSPRAPCLEYWLNRYQTLLVGALGIAVAYYAAAKAWSAVQLQIKEARDLASQPEREAWQEAREFGRYRYNHAIAIINLLKDYLDDLDGMVQSGSEEEYRHRINLDDDKYIKELTKLSEDCNATLRLKVSSILIIVSKIDNIMINFLKTADWRGLGLRFKENATTKITFAIRDISNLLDSLNHRISENI